MFYSHEILTSRKYGVATVWLMATLGPKSNHKKVSKKAINGVDVPRACDTITGPETPLALRLQGSLLVGVSRVFREQCEYMKLDAQSLAIRLQGVAHRGKELQIDRAIESGRSEQLNLADDPAFDLDGDIGFDLSMFDMPGDRSFRRSLAAPVPGPSQSSLQVEDSAGEEQSWFEAEAGPDFSSINVSSIHGGDSGAGFTVASDVHSTLASNNQAIFDDLEILMDDDGALVFGDEDEAVPTRSRPTATGNEYEGIGEPMEEQENTHQHGMTNENADAPDMFGDGGDIDVIQAEGIIHAIESPTFNTTSAQMPIEDNQESYILDGDVDESNMTVEAPQRQKKAAKPIRPDAVTEFNNTQLKDWHTRYLKYVSDLRFSKLNRLSTAQAKRNAAFWILDQGIGGVAVNFSEDIETHPLAVFSGQSLLKLLHGQKLTRKRSLSDASNHEEEARASHRPRPEHLDRSQQPDDAIMLEDDDGIQAVQDDYVVESEVGRQAPSSLKDNSSQMPWNISSRRGTSRPYGSALHQPSSSVFGMSGGFEMGPPSDLPRYRSRLTSASPLLGRGRPLSRSGGDDDLSLDHSTMDTEQFADLDGRLAGDLEDDFELYGPAAAVSTQQAAESQWLSGTLEMEAYNFLSFLSSKIQERTGEEDLGEETDAVTTFEALLPPVHNSPAVAAQGFLHVLALATKSLVAVEQQHSFGSICLKLMPVGTTGAGVSAP